MDKLPIWKVVCKNGKWTRRPKWPLEQNIIPDVSSSQPTVLGGWLSSHFGNLTPQIWGVNIFNGFGSDRFRKSGKCCPLWTTNPKIWNGCDAVTHTLLLILTYVLSLNYMWSGLIPYKSRVLSIFYHKNGPVWLNLFATHTYNYYSTPLLLVWEFGYTAFHRIP